MNPALSNDSQPDSRSLAWLQLLHLADSALPIGAMSHSFGIESLVAEGGLTAAHLPLFFDEWVSGIGQIEAAFCIRAYSILDESAWHLLNSELSALKPARESRAGSLRLGKRFLSLALQLLPDPRLQSKADAHLATAFGLAGSVLCLDPVIVASAYLHQALFGAVSVCQRLLPFGQSAAMRLLWEMKTRITQVAQAAQTTPMDELWTLQPMLEIASMRHPRLSTRLFIS